MKEYLIKHLNYIKKKHPYRENPPRPTANSVPSLSLIKDDKKTLIQGYFNNHRDRPFRPKFELKESKDLRFFNKILKNLQKEIKRQKLNIPIKTDLKFSDFPEVLKFIK